MPSRSGASGRHSPCDSAPSAWKPFIANRQRPSTPPTTAASTTPDAISRRAEANAFALELHAVETTYAGPLVPSNRRR